MVNEAMNLNVVERQNKFLQTYLSTSATLTNPSNCLEFDEMNTLYTYRGESECDCVCVCVCVRARAYVLNTSSSLPKL